MRRLTFAGVVTIGFVTFLLIAPRIISDITVIEILTTGAIFAMFAASWDILSGYTGQENFGHAAFIGAGGFTVGLFTKYADLPLEGSLVLGAIVAAAIGIAVGIPCLRLRGPYLALATLAAAAALLRLSFVFKRYTGGEEGISGIPNLGVGAVTGRIGRFLGKAVYGGASFDDLRNIDRISLTNYYIVLVGMVAVVGGLYLVGRSRRGLVLRSIQQDESAAEAAGVNTTRYKLIAFALSSACAGIAGALWVHVQSQVNINTLTVDLSLLVIVMAIIGGAGSIVGPAAGAYLIVLLEDYALDRFGIQEGSQVKPMLFSGLLIVVMLVQPRGVIAPALRSLGQRRVFAGKSHG